MNRESSQSLSIACDDERPSKRARVESSTNSVGIYVLRRRMSCSTSLDPCVRGGGGKLDVQFTVDSALQEPRNSNLSKRNSVRSSDSPSTIVPTKKLSDPSTHRYNHETQEYDEGMYVYNRAFLVDSQASESIRSASLFYNIGLTNVCQGKYQDACRWFDLALVRVATGFLTAEAALVMVCINHNIGYCQYRLGSNNEALKSYRNALTLTQERQLGALHAATSLNCVGVIHFHNDLELKESKKILAMFEQCLVVYRQLKGPNSTEVATILNNIGRVYFLLTKFDEAMRAYEQSLEIRRSLFGSTSIDVAVTICNKGQTHHQRGELDEALKCYQEFLELAHARLRPTHRDIATTYKFMADIHHEKGDKENARVMYEKALQAGRGAFGSFHPDISCTLKKLGNIYLEMQDFDTALKYYSEGLRVELAVLEECHPHTIVSFMSIAQIHRLRGNFAAALSTYTEAHAIQLKAKGPNCIEVAGSLSNMALMHYQLKSFAAAFDLYQEVLRIQRDHFGSDEHLEVAATLTSIGLVLFSKSIFGLAKNCFTDSLRIRKSILGPEHRDVAVLWYNIATVHQEMGDDDMAITLYKESLRVERAALGEKHDDVILSLQHLGLVYQQQGNLDLSLQYFSEALDMERSKGKSRLAVAKLLNLIGNIYLQRAQIPQMMECYSEACRIYQSSEQHNDTLIIAGYNFYGLSKLHPPGAAMA